MTNSSKNPRTNILPHLIFSEILPRFPAKSLCRFKSVSREWNSVIKSVKPTSRSILTVKNDAFPLEAAEVYEDIILNSNTFDVNIEPPWFLLSSCNGLVFMISTSDEGVGNELSLPDHLHLLDFVYVVYNPVLGVDHFVEIPHPEEYLLADGDDWNGNYSFGFGYVSSRDDYYIVAIDVSYDTKIGVYTYSLRSQQWKNEMITIGDEEEDDEEEGLPLKFKDRWYCRIGILVNEALHWGMSQGEDYQFIFVYDLVGLEDFRLIDLPYRGFGDATLQGHSTFALTSLDDCLCAWANYDKNVIEMWMMKEYGVVESWTRVFRFQMKDDRCCRKMFGFIKPKMVMLFTDVDELILADFSCHPPKFSNAVLENRFEAVSYFPSLVSVFALISEQ